MEELKRAKKQGKRRCLGIRINSMNTLSPGPANKILGKAKLKIAKKRNDEIKTLLRDRKERKNKRQVKKKKSNVCILSLSPSCWPIFQDLMQPISTVKSG